MQSKTIDVKDGTALISLKNEVVMVMNCIDSHHDEWYDIAFKLAVKAGIEESKRRTIGRPDQTILIAVSLSITNESIPFH